MQKNKKQKKTKTGCFSEYASLIFSLNSNSNREFFKYTKKSRMFLRTGFVQPLIFRYQVIQCNTEVKN